jgi:hypothetical protein
MKKSRQSDKANRPQELVVENEVTVLGGKITVDETVERLIALDIKDAETTIVEGSIVNEELYHEDTSETVVSSDEEEAVDKVHESGDAILTKFAELIIEININEKGHLRQFLISLNDKLRSTGSAISLQVCPSPQESIYATQVHSDFAKLYWDAEGTCPCEKLVLVKIGYTSKLYKERVIDDRTKLFRQLELKASFYRDPSSRDNLENTIEGNVRNAVGWRVKPFSINDADSGTEFVLTTKQTLDYLVKCDGKDTGALNILYHYQTFPLPNFTTTKLFLIMMSF